MAIDPKIDPNVGTIAGIVSSLGDLDRRLRGVEGGLTLGPNAITTGQIGAGAVQVGNIAANSITTAMLQAGSITAGTIAANAVTATAIAANSINANHINAAQITSTHIASDTIVAGNIAAGAITTSELAAGAVTSDKITVTTLSAITTNMGGITAGTVTGATVQTATSGSRVVMNSTGLTGYALDGTTKVFEINAGSGVASFTGIANIDPSSVIPGGTITTNTLPGDRIVSNSIQALQIAAGAITTNTLAAGAVTAQKITIEFGGKNMLTDTSFAYTTPQWSAVNAALVSSFTGQQRSSSPNAFVAKITSSAAGSFDIRRTSFRVSATPGATYTASAYFKAAATTRNVGVYLDWYDSGGTRISAAPGTFVAATSSGYTRATVTGVAPAGTVTVSIIAQVAGAAAAGEIFYISEPQLEPGDIVTSYSRMPGEILPGEVGTTQITDDAITTNKILAGTIQGSDIAASTITATNISVSSLSAISANLGTVTAGTLTGGTIQSASSGGRIVLDSTGLKQYATNGTTVLTQILPNGTASFSGSLIADGVQFDTYTTTKGTTALPPESVAWISAGGTSPLTEIFTRDTAGTFDDGLVLAAYGKPVRAWSSPTSPYLGATQSVARIIAGPNDESDFMSTWSGRYSAGTALGSTANATTNVSLTGTPGPYMLVARLSGPNASRIHTYLIHLYEASITAHLIQLGATSYSTNKGNISLGVNGTQGAFNGSNNGNFITLTFTNSSDAGANTGYYTWWRMSNSPWG